MLKGQTLDARYTAFIDAAAARQHPSSRRIRQPGLVPVRIRAACPYHRTKQLGQQACCAYRQAGGHSILLTACNARCNG
jgi:hypothetical protein